MNLPILFDPVQFIPEGNALAHNSFFMQISYHGEDFPVLRGIHIAIIGLTEIRGKNENKSMGEAASAIREKLYALKKGQSAYKVADLGDLRPGVDLQESYMRIGDVEIGRAHV